MNDIIVVKQLPVIEEQLRLIRDEIQKRVSTALSLECTEETVKEIKAVRAGLSKDFKDLEERRKEVKNKVLAPYEEFEKVYKSCVTDIFRPADSQLKTKIDEVENGLRAEKQADIEAYFQEYCSSKGIDFVSFGMSGIDITLSASKKSLKDKAKTFIDRVADDLAMIDTQEHAAEILVEYRKTLNASLAVTTVTQRHHAIEAERQRVQRLKEAEEVRLSAESRVDKAIEANLPTLQAPVPLPGTGPKAIGDAMDGELFQLVFTVTGTRAQLKALKTFLIEGGYQYE